jgi:hypothetical protein
MPITFDDKELTFDERIHRSICWPPDYNGILPGTAEGEARVKRAAWHRYDMKRQFAGLEAIV